MSALLQADGVSFAYGDRPILRDVGIALAAGQVVTLIGPNGSGKSTLIKVLLGHLRGRGRIAWEGKALSAWSRRALARRVAYMPQFPAYDSDHTVADVLRLGRAPYQGAFGLESDHDLHVVRDVARLLELDEFLARRMDQLSGGQRQRAFIGRCLVQQPKALLLDEPNSFLDLKHQVELLRLLRQLAKEQSLGVLMASHDLNLSAMFADQLVLLSEGAIVASGPAAQVLQADLIGQVYGLPMRTAAHPGWSVPLVFPDVQLDAQGTFRPRRSEHEGATHKGQGGWMQPEEPLPADFLAHLQVLEDAYLRETDPILQSGFHGGPERWRAERGPILEAIDGDGDLLDVGCANGYLLECLVKWGDERGVRLTPHGVDYSARLIEMARQRLPNFAGNLHAANGWTWRPPRRYRYVYALYDCVPESFLEQYVGRLLDRAVEQGGRLIVGAYGSRSRGMPPFDVAGRLRSFGMAVAGRTQGGNPPVTAFAWIDKQAG